MRLHFTNDLYFLTITCRPSRSFFLFTFLFYFYIHSLKLYTCGPLWGKPSFVHLWQTFSVHALELFSLRRTVYIQTLFTLKDFFIFPNTLMVHTKISSCTLVAHTSEFLSTHHLHTRILFIHIFLLHTCINKNLFLFFMNMTFIQSASFFLLGFLVHFILFFLGGRP